MPTTTRAVLAAVVTAVGSLMFLGSPASAATLPKCDNAGTFISSWSGDRVVIPKYTPTGSNACSLVRGAHNEGVAALQTTLSQIYGQNIAVDNDFGPATQQALRNVQSELGIHVDGQYGTESRDHICWLDYTANGRTACTWLNNNH